MNARLQYLLDTNVLSEISARKRLMSALSRSWRTLSHPRFTSVFSRLES